MLALPSLKEGWGQVVGEAAAHGVPAVAYHSAGGPRESVHDGVSGVLVDDHTDFCTTVTALLADAGRRQQLSSGALATADTYTWAQTVNSFEQVLEGRPVRVAEAVVPEAG